MTDTLGKLTTVIGKFFSVPASQLNGASTAADVDGWDSVSQATLVFEIEDQFGIQLGFKETIACRNLAALAALIERQGALPQVEPPRAPIVMFGNCQAESLAACMQHHSAVAPRYTMHFVQSYTLGGDEEKTMISPQILTRCPLLMEQLTPNVGFKQKNDLREGCQTVTFPSLDFNLLWPLQAVEPRNRPEPDHPFGRFSYGDRIINSVVSDGLTGDTAWEAYLVRSAAALKNVARFETIERQRWDNLDGDLSVRMGEEIFARYRGERLFYTYNHPSSGLLCRLGARLLQAAGLVESTGLDDAYQELRRLFSWEFGENYALPIHPLVAKAFELEWWSPNMPYRRDDGQFDYEESIRKQIDWR